MKEHPVIVIGAGIGGLSAAISLAARGVPVEVFEAASAPGGKMRQVEVAGQRLDAGPTVFTMRWIFEALFEEAGTRLADWVTLRQASVLARHGWEDGSRLDLFACPARTEEAISAFSGPGALAGFRRFRAEARELYEALNPRFIEAPRAGPLAMATRFPPEVALRLLMMGPASTLWQRLGRHFADPWLRQLYARYATYCGSSPFQAPGLLSLIAHVEAEGVWLIRGGMHALARQMAALAGRLGVRIHYNSPVRRIAAPGRAEAIHLADGTRHPARAVIFNGDAQALASGLLGPEARRAVPPAPAAQRSLSALVWSMVAEAEGLPLSRHTVLFPQAYRPEFDAIFREGRLPANPTVYICAQDRDAADGPAPRGPERLHIHVNAPANGDTSPPSQEEIERCTQAMITLAARTGVRLTPSGQQITTPERFHRLFPATGGALYGPANHGMLGSFRRRGAASRVPGLYLAGGSVHPGPGVPMAAMSGRLAAAQLAQDWGLDWDPASTNRSRPAATSGGISTGSPTAGASA
ncbi:MAG: 1-hydroxycarotenoid 3,4-desaturase CrtD [Pseudomonadota bacterium]